MSICDARLRARSCRCRIDETNGGTKMTTGIVKMVLSVIAISSLGFASAAAQSAAEFPNRMVRIVVPHPAGGGPDTFTRLVADKLAAKWKQPVIIENRVGGGSNIGATQVARADADGYTLLAAAPGPIAINGSLFKSLSYDPEKWTPISILTRQPMLLGAKKELTANSVSELIALAKQSPDKFTYGSLGLGSISQLTMIRFFSMAGVKMLHVPFTGSSPALVALMSNQVDIIFDNPVTFVPPFQDDRIKVLAGGFGNRSGRVGRRHDRQPGTEPVGSTPAETAKFLDEERAKWRDVVRSANLSVN
jgi:tripartite-type tricarboxylate transporter receptor subunit TctC